ncbi:hypothetical protein G9U51_08290 [Calidifontibacter sp. DB0510]|uniref:DUF3168 domain-containing protein n=1 Tax=Metallococcus carri TaxID=1656884 RepID=A0A967EAD6_9MICO|nr:hypothetical protein [Metallococcus carri]NHN55774.1 hypothetical protein [Metallococcus carri]NOP38537.1 hypothetical protein [Calidifontibacter sp. DB2511S]
MALLIPPDAEQVLTTVLADRLADRPEVYAQAGVDIRVPNPMPARMVVINRDGGTRMAPGIWRCRMRIRTWARSEGEATDLAGLVEALIYDSRNVPPICGWADLGGPSSAEDESGKPMRVQWVELLIRGTEKE